MIDIRKVRSLAVPGDSILSGSRKFFSLSNLIQVGQTPQTGNKRPSLFSHERKYYDFITVVESTIDFNPYNPMNRKRMQSGVQRNRLDTIVGDKDTYGYLIRYKALKQKDVCAIKDAMIAAIVEGHNGNPDYIYDISGLFGSLLTYWLIPSVKSNPLAGYGMYCSAFCNKIDRKALGDLYDSSENTDKNTSPELRWQFFNKHPELFEVIPV